MLRRRWAGGAVIGFVLLNPSTADELQDDPTIRRCIGFARSWGYSGLVLGNIFAFRSTDPRGLRSASDPIGPANDTHLRAIADEANGEIVCGWGAHGAFMDRGAEVLRLLADWGARPKALAWTADGHPGHPLYLKADLKPSPCTEPPQ